MSKNIIYLRLRVCHKPGRCKLQKRDQSILKEFGCSGRQREALRPLRARGEGTCGEIGGNGGGIGGIQVLWQKSVTVGNYV